MQQREVECELMWLLFALFYDSRAQGCVPPSLEAPADQAPDSLCDSASRESTSGTCFSAWRTREGPIAHSCSIKASSNSGSIKKRRSRTRGLDISAGTSFDQPQHDGRISREAVFKHVEQRMGANVGAPPLVSAWPCSSEAAGGQLSLRSRTASPVHTKEESEC